MPYLALFPFRAEGKLFIVGMYYQTGKPLESLIEYLKSISLRCFQNSLTYELFAKEKENKYTPKQQYRFFRQLESNTVKMEFLEGLMRNLDFTEKDPEAFFTELLEKFSGLAQHTQFNMLIDFKDKSKTFLDREILDEDSRFACRDGDKSYTYYLNLNGGERA